MDQSDLPDVVESVKRGGRRSKRQTKSKNNSFPDEAPPYIEEKIAGSKSSQTIKYFVGEVLGKGAAATVYKGKNATTGEIVAIKKIFKGGMRAEALKMFLKAVETEYNLMTQLNHPNVVAMKGRVEDASNVYIILEYVNGGSLATYLSKYGTFSAEIAAVQMKQVLQGLDYLHGRGIVHRDIKAANLLITKSGVVKLADFGVSAQLDHTAEKRYSVVGTPYWMAPEVISMTGHTGRSDIWSLGCTLLELITGHPPYWDLDQMRAVFCIVQDERPPIPSEITGDLCRFLHRCFTKDPEKRASAAELLLHPYILNGKFPATPSGKLDTRVLKQNLRVFHGGSADDISESESSTDLGFGNAMGGATPSSPLATSSSLATSSTSSTPNITISTNSSAPRSPSPSHNKWQSGSLGDRNVVPLDGALSSPSSTSTPSPIPSELMVSPSGDSPRNVARVTNARSSEPDPHEPVPSLHHYSESSSLLQSKEKYIIEPSGESAPCACVIL